MNQNHVYGAMMRTTGFAGQATVDAYYEQQRLWRIEAWKEGCSFVPTVLPGYNDRSIRSEENNPILPRALAEGAEEGSLFTSSLSKARHLLDSELNDLIVINSFNNFEEDTQVLPVYGGSTSSPETLTDGFVYEAYGETYFSLLTEAPSASPTEASVEGEPGTGLPNWCVAAEDPPGIALSKQP